MHRILLAALALACVCFPAILVPTLSAEFRVASAIIGTIAVAAALIFAAQGLKQALDTELPRSLRLICGAAVWALVCVAVSPAFAAEVATLGDTAVILPWGQWVTAIAQTATEILIPVIIAAVGIAARHLPWYVQMWFTTQRIDRMVRLAADYALNAVSGATAGKASSIDVGHPLLKAGLERAIGSSPEWLIEAAGGTKGITERLFRAFHFDETVTDANTLTPFLANLPVSVR